MVEWISGVPAFVKISASFAGILAASRMGLPLGWSIIIHSIVLSLWAGAGLSSVMLHMRGLLAPSNTLLIAVILMLLYFTEALNATGRINRTVSALKKRLSSKQALLAGFPALIGLLPMPGGAVVSAPLVSSMDSENEISPELKIAVNYWFRHIWEYWWPLYPGVILAIRYSRLPLGFYYLIMMPFTAIAVVSGRFFILRHTGNRVHSAAGAQKLDFRDIAATLLPIGIIVVTSVVGSLLLPAAGIFVEDANQVSVLAGIAAALIFVFRKNPSLFSSVIPFLKNGKTWSLIVVVAGILMFSQTLKLEVGSGGSHTLVSLMKEEFSRMGIPVVLVIMILPFISGFVTGLCVGYVGSSFPLVFALLGDDPGMGALAATVVLAYSFGYMGMILSPVHICFVVTGEYFKTGIYRAYPYLAGPVMSILVFSLILSGALYYFF